MNIHMKMMYIIIIITFVRTVERINLITERDQYIMNILTPENQFKNVRELTTNE